jgi:flagellar biosynthesis regulator FlaF
MSYGVNQYRRSQGGAMSPRETEAAAFAYVNGLLAGADDTHARLRALGKNQQLWSLLIRDVGSSSNELPAVLKSDILKVGLFSTRVSIAAMGDNRPLQPLIQINEDMISALRSVPAPVPTMPVSGQVRCERLSLAG